MVHLSITPHYVNYALPAGGGDDSPLNTAVPNCSLVINRLVAVLIGQIFKKYLPKKSKQKQAELRKCKLKGKHKRPFLT